jgi:hypothetical protein
MTGSVPLRTLFLLATTRPSSSRIQDSKKPRRATRVLRNPPIAKNEHRSTIVQKSSTSRGERFLWTKWIGLFSPVASVFVVGALYPPCFPRARRWIVRRPCYVQGMGSGLANQLDYSPHGTSSGDEDPPFSKARRPLFLAPLGAHHPSHGRPHLHRDRFTNGSL